MKQLSPVGFRGLTAQSKDELTNRIGYLMSSDSCVEIVFHGRTVPRAQTDDIYAGPEQPLAVQSKSVWSASKSSWVCIMTCFLFAAGFFMHRGPLSGCMSDGRRGRRVKVWQDRHLHLSKFC